MTLSNIKNIEKIISKHKYRLDKSKISSKKLKKKAVKLIREIGFCVIDNVISKNFSDYIDEIEKAKYSTKSNTELFKKLLKKKLSEKELLNHPKLEVRMSRFRNRKCKLVNDIFWLPKFSKYLGDRTITDIIKANLDEHVRIGQIHSKFSKYQNINSKKVIIRNDSFGLPRVTGGLLNAREWHTDWPHDPWAYGGRNKSENIGCIKEPFPDLAMGLVVVHFLNDSIENLGTWVVPGSHKSGISPRHGKFSTLLPIKKEHQVKVNAGSVFIQDTRLWHSSPLLNKSLSKRVIVVSRWYPWWLEIDDYAPDSRFNIVARPLSKKDFEKLPNNLKPYLLYLCSEKKEYIKNSLIQKTNLYLKRSKKFYRK